MDFINLLSAVASWPEGGFWQTIIGWFGSFITNYGWTIIVFTICLKLVLLPLDFFQKVSARKQAALQPEMQKIQKRYGANKDLLNQKTMELYKNKNYNVITSCLGMLVSMVLTLTIFITLFNSMNQISQFKIKDEFAQLDLEYRTVYTATFDGTNQIEAQATAQEAVSTKYGEIKEGWLWVKNIWRPDTWVTVFPNFDDYIKISATNFSTNAVGQNYIYKGLDGTEYNLAEETATENEKTTAITNAYNAAKADFEIITAQIKIDHSGWNGLLLLVLLAGAITFLSQQFANKGFKNKKKDKMPESIQSATGTPNTKMLGFVLTGLMLVFTIMYSAAFALYIVTNSLMSMLISLCINTILDSKKEKKETHVLATGRAQIIQKGKK